jgi:Undecaprenyl-phosphate glucose phosphotransferase
MIPKRQHIVLSHILIEFILLNFSIALVFYVRNYDIFSTSRVYDAVNNILLLALIFNLIWGLIVLLNGELDLYVSSKLKKRIKYIILNTFLFIGMTSTITILFKLEYFNRTSFLLPIFLFSTLNLLFFSLLASYNQWKNKSNSFGSALLVLGAKSKWRHITPFSKKIQERGYNIVGFLSDKKGQDDAIGLEALGDIDMLKDVISDKKVDEIFVSATLKKRQLKSVYDMADYQGIRVNIIPKAHNFSGTNLKSYDLGGLAVFPHRQTPLDDFNNFLLKRTFDIFFSLTVLIVFFPVFLLIGLIIYMDGKGAVMYTPMRKGVGGKTFRCYKFRTMSVCDDIHNGTKSTKVNDERITAIGKYLRKFDLDELPQFFNVLIGDMSVVGPRPHRSNLQNDFREIVNDYMVRSYVKPGITGWAQVNGWRGPTQTLEQKQERIKHDLWFIENWSFFLDLKIIFLTVFGRETRKNAF